jgi:hypothetical protein
MDLTQAAIEGANVCRIGDFISSNFLELVL